MKEVKDILYKVSLEEVAGITSEKVERLVFDSRKARKGDMYFAISGTKVDGHQFIPNVIENGVSNVVCEKLPIRLEDGVNYFKVDNARKALSLSAGNYYNNPSSQIRIVGVTGTNGKTSVATMLYELFTSLGYHTGLVSTVENKIGTTVVPATHTTPDPVSLQGLFNDMVEEGCTHCFMEVSSHALDQDRVRGVEFSGGVFTNITHDHLDYHGTFDNYIAAKKLLFDGLGKDAFALVNIDDKRGRVMVQNTVAKKKFFSVKSPSDYKAKVLTNTLQGLELDINHSIAWFKLIGSFNAYNLAAVYGVAMEMEEDEEEVLKVLSSMNPVNGRFNQFLSTSGVTAVVDYAHTPDALENVLKTIQDITEGQHQVITVVGCGGDRDKDKRPVMADIASKLSTKAILTSDNPRSEEPQTILDDMWKGVGITQRKKVVNILDRKEAIRMAVQLAEPGDVVLVAGKGHENYQEINGERKHFDDKEELLNAFKELS